MKLPFLTLLIALPISSASSSPINVSIDGSDILHYTLGGGSIVRHPARERKLNSAKLGLGWDMNLQCGLLDPKLTIKNQLNGLTEGFQDTMGSMLDNATAAVSALPGRYIQKKDPGLYDMLSNGVLQGKFDFADINTSCENMATTMVEMTGDAYGTMAKAKAWSQAVKSGDAVQAKKDVDKDMGDSGITWKDGRSAGGRNQPAINATKDAVEAGFTMLSQRSQKAKKEGLYRYWDSQTDMSEWVTGVIGSQSVQTGVDKSKTGATPGIGLSQEVSKHSQKLELELRDAVTEQKETSHFPKALIEALKESQVDKNTLSRIASELALSHAIEKALYARRTLLTGKYEVNIAQHNAAQDDIDDAVTRLEREIDMLRYEAEVRQQVGTRTAQAVVDDYRYQRPQVRPSTKTAPSQFLKRDRFSNRTQGEE